jgi:subtilase family serine protease
MRSLIFAAILTTAATLPSLAQVAVSSGTTVSVGSPISLTFYVAPANTAAAEAKAKSLQTPGSSDYHKFLTLSQFVTDYAVSDAELNSIEASLVNLGFTIGHVYPNHLAIEVLGSVGTAETALGVKLQEYEKDGHKGFASVTPVKLPAELEGKIRGVGGLNTISHPTARHMVSAIGQKSIAKPVSGKLVGGTPGNYLPSDYEKFYDVLPLYSKGFTGRGTTIGIVTLADFKASDAYTFWKQIGLDVSQSRITKVSVDGGVGPNNFDGEGETDIDTEYSGAIAPDANLRVYIAPNNTEANFINDFEEAASENLADTVSVSWGEPELLFFYDFATNTPADTSLLDDFHDVFLEMALQGQTLYVASGDSGSFDTVRDVCPAFGTPTAKNPVCNAPYAVDQPGNDPLVTAAGGTTLPFSFTLTDGIHLYVDQERAWSWDYIATEAAEQGHGSDITLSDVFSTGDGGGVSAYFARPWYQSSVPGVTKTMPGQYLAADYGSGAQIQYILPSDFAGRNMPDISTNADPESGYQYIEENTIQNFYGGTSFVAPQLNGVTALFVQSMKHRIGQINPAIYHLGYPDTKDEKQGDNWGYSALSGFDNASGVGTLDASKLLEGLKSLATDK